MGSTNDEEFLMCVTGIRRWLPVEVQGVIKTEKLARDLLNLWGAAVAIYREMREAQPYGDLPLYLQDPGAIAEAERLQFKAKVAQDSDILADRLAPFLNEIKATDERFSDVSGTTKRRREFVTIAECNEELFGDLNKPTPNIGRVIGKVLLANG